MGAENAPQDSKVSASIELIFICGCRATGRHSIRDPTREAHVTHFSCQKGIRRPAKYAPRNAQSTSQQTLEDQKGEYAKNDRFWHILCPAVFVAIKLHKLQLVKHFRGIYEQPATAT